MDANTGVKMGLKARNYARGVSPHTPTGHLQIIQYDLSMWVSFSGVREQCVFGFYCHFDGRMTPHSALSIGRKILEWVVGTRFRGRRPPRLLY